MSADAGQGEQGWYSEDLVESWDQIEERHKRYSCMPPGPDCYWIFRGDKPGDALATKLEQAFADYGVPESKMRQYEMEMIREFQRKGGLYLDREPDKDDVLEWLAIASYLLLAEKPAPLVFALNPFRLNRRLIIQQALFLISGDIRLPFVENLRCAYGHDDRTIRHHMHKIVLKPGKKERNRILRELRGMNVMTEVLFPDLSGFARSLVNRLAYVDLY